ncbi:sugar phosphate permease [Virgibacillus natechei]|uniref:Sugar phosphate permease n=1 Tax=Virgibacillus natechei TaxID=1216297 RepID=A0ABS4IIG4_9BACI|nr:MFS transporter [Virgibacillus natechei]MBP1970737.1 sugar phosphate permease [Virgibacillus natechei]UZD12024.1 MFS transporter [Virgibacillus natechei]
MELCIRLQTKGVIYWFSTKKRGIAMGIKQTGVTLGSALAALILLPLASELGWRPVLFGACLLLMVAGCIAFRFYNDPPVEKNNHSINVGQPRFLTSVYTLFKHKAFMLVSISAVGLNGGQMILNTYIVLFAYEILGISLFLSGILLVISEASGSIGRVVWGIISDTLFNGKRVIILIIIAMVSAVSALTLTLLPADSPFWMVVPIIMIFGFCISGFNGIWMNAVTEFVPREQSGVASGFSIMQGSWGVIIAPPLFGLMVDLGNYQLGWMFLFAILLIIAILLILVIFIEDKPLQSEK